MTCYDRETGNPLAGLSGAERARIIWPSFRASSGVEPCDVPFRYASDSIPRYRGMVARWHAHLHDLATAIHEISGLDFSPNKSSLESGIRHKIFFLRSVDRLARLGERHIKNIIVLEVRVV